MTATPSARSERPRTRLGRPFQKGNPGKAKGTRDRRTAAGIEAARALSGEAVDKLRGLIHGRSSRVAFEALKLVLAYSWGTPKQTLELVGDLGNLSRELSAALEYARLRGAVRVDALPVAAGVATAPGALALSAAHETSGGVPIEAVVVEAEAPASSVPTMNTYPKPEQPPPAVSETGAASLQEASGTAIAADDVEAGHENASATGAHDAAAPGTVAPDPEGGFLS